MFDIGILSLEDAYAMRVQLNNLIEQYEKTARKVLDGGGTHKDFALKEGKVKREWFKEEDLVSKLRDAGYLSKDIYNVKLKGIPAIEKLIDGTDFDLAEHMKLGRQKDTMIYTGSKA